MMNMQRSDGRLYACARVQRRQHLCDAVLIPSDQQRHRWARSREERAQDIGILERDDFTSSGTSDARAGWCQRSPDRFMRGVRDAAARDQRQHALKIEIASAADVIQRGSRFWVARPTDGVATINRSSSGHVHRRATGFRVQPATLN